MVTSQEVIRAQARLARTIDFDFVREIFDVGVCRRARSGDPGCRFPECACGHKAVSFVC